MSENFKKDLKKSAEAVERVRQRCRRAGLDVVHAFRVGALPDELQRGLVEPFGPESLAILIGNGRALWPIFKRELPHPLPAHPVEAHVEAAVGSAVRELTAELRWSHRQHEGGYLPFQRIAAAAGYAHLAPSHLVISEHAGPWTALRAIVLLDLPGPEGPAPVAYDPCSACDEPCMTAFEVARQRDDWRAWLAVRDACPVGREARYDDDQVAYHYTKDRALLQRDDSTGQ